MTINKGKIIKNVSPSGVIRSVTGTSSIFSEYNKMPLVIGGLLGAYSLLSGDNLDQDHEEAKRKRLLKKAATEAGFSTIEEHQQFLNDTNSVIVEKVLDPIMEYPTDDEMLKWKEIKYYYEQTFLIFILFIQLIIFLSVISTTCSRSIISCFLLIPRSIFW